MKQRLDKLLVTRGLAKDIKQAKAYLMAGEVLVNQEMISLPGTLVDNQAEIALRQAKPYVSRGGHKLAAALQAFDVTVTGKVCADIGASTGGFCDVLLQQGAKKIYAIDVAYGVFAWKLRQDPRIVLMERTNARKVSHLPQAPQVITCDVSFISLKQILFPAKNWLADQADFIVLVKPQFEAAKHEVEPGGVVRDPKIHRQVLLELGHWCETQDFKLFGLINSPITGPAGNREFLLHLGFGKSGKLPDFLDLIENCLSQ